MRRYTVDRLEDQGWAVIEDEQSRTLRVPTAWLPPRTQEADVIVVSEMPGGPGVRVLKFEADSGAKEERLKQARESRARLRPGPEGDLKL